MNSKFNSKQKYGAPGQQLDQMDYAAYFTSAPQPYQFLNGLPPTPSHSHTVNSDDYINGSPAQSNFDFQNFDAYNHFNASGLPEPPTPNSQPRTSLGPNSHDGSDLNGMDLSGSAAGNGNRSGNAISGAEMQGQRQGSNSGNEEDEENMTPAQSRRKAQNRAAQRAFRERKEKHVKELEAQVAALRASTNNIATENERLRLSLQKVSTENEILKATSHHANRHSASPDIPLPQTTGPMHFSPKDFYTEVLEGHGNQHLQQPSHRIINGEGGTRLLGAGATWDFILGSQEFKLGQVDVARVSEELRGRAKCDGQGPVFEERDVRKAIEASAGGGGDDLL